MPWVAVPAEHRPLFQAALPKSPLVDTIPLFGGVAARVHGNVFAGLFARSVVVHLSPADREAALALEGAEPFDPMGDGRKSEKVMLPEAMMDDAPELRAWVARAFAYASALPPKTAKPKRKAAPKKRA